MDNSKQVMTCLGIALLTVVTFAAQDKGKLWTVDPKGQFHLVKPDAKTPLNGTWEGWSGSDSMPGSIQRCEVTISGAYPSQLTGRVVQKGLGMGVETSTAGSFATAGQKIGRTALPRQVVVNLVEGGKSLPVSFTLTDPGPVEYLSGTSSNGTHYQLWRNKSGGSIMPATVHY